MADRMQDDAIQRFKQMYSKTPSQNTENRTHSENNKPQQPHNQTADISEKQSEPIHKSENKSVLDIFMKDKEKSLILLLIVLLINEKADTTLILALMYLII